MFCTSGGRGIQTRSPRFGKNLAMLESNPPAHLLLISGTVLPPKRQAREIRTAAPVPVRQLHPGSSPHLPLLHRPVFYSAAIRMRQLNSLQAERKYCSNRQDSLITDAAIKELAQPPSSEPNRNPRISCHCVSKVAHGKVARALPSIRILETDSRVQ